MGVRKISKAIRSSFPHLPSSNDRVFQGRKSLLKVQHVQHYRVQKRRKIMNTKLSPEAKNAVMAAFIIGLLFVGPIVTGMVLLLAMEVIYSPWPMIASICMIAVLIGAWTVLHGRLKSDMLHAWAYLTAVLCLVLSLLSPLPDFSSSFQHNAPMIVYIICLLNVSLHSVLALMVAVGLNPQVETKVVATAAES